MDINKTFIILLIIFIFIIVVGFFLFYKNRTTNYDVSDKIVKIDKITVENKFRYGVSTKNSPPHYSYHSNIEESVNSIDGFDKMNMNGFTINNSNNLKMNGISYLF